MTECDVRGAGLDYSDARPLYFNLFSEPRTPRRMFENIGLGLQADACNRGAAAEADTSGEHALRRACTAAAAEVGAIGEQQLEADENGEQQLKRMQSGQGAAADSKRTQVASSRRNRRGKQTQSWSSSSAQRAVRRRITHGSRTRGK